jgi:hypothetical protein
VCAARVQRKPRQTAFPAFLPRGHKLLRFADAAFHRDCFEKLPEAPLMHSLFARFRAVLERRPRSVASLEEGEAWALDALGKLMAEEGFLTPLEPPTPVLMHPFTDNRRVTTPSPYAPAVGEAREARRAPLSQYAGFREGSLALQQ